MKDYLYFILVLIIALAMTIASASRADSLADCKATLSLCDKAVSADEALIGNMQLQIEAKDGYIRSLEKTVKDEDSLLPWYGWMLIGGAAGILTIEVIK